MQLRLDICFHTDGDFYFVDPGSMIDPKSSLYEGAHIEYTWVRNDEKFMYYLVATGDDLGCRLAARDLLEQMTCSLRVSKTHVYLVKDIYEFLNGPIDNNILFDRDKDIDYDDIITGNYDGTRMELTIKREENEPRQRTRFEIEAEYKELVKDSTIVETGPNSHGFANQERRDKLLAEYRATLDPEYQLAIWLHEQLCHYNHTDGCSWSYEIDGVRDNWEEYAHKKYLEMANRMIFQCSDIALIKNIIGSIREDTKEMS